MAPSNAELNFIARMQNQASATIAQLGQGFQTMGSQAAGAQGSVNSLATNITGLNQALQLMKASLGAVGAGIQEPLRAFRDYDKSMTVVKRITDSSSDTMTGFSEGFDKVARTLKALPIERVREIAAQSAALGLTGNVNILRYTESIGKLETSLKDLGTDAPKLIFRTLNAVGETNASLNDIVPRVDAFGSALVRIAKDSASSEHAILGMTVMLAQAAAQFKISEGALLGLGSAAADLNFQPQLFGTSVQRSMQQLKIAALDNSEGMRDLTEFTGLSRDAFLDLINTKPEQAFLTFLDVIKAMNGAGQNTIGFLTKLKLQAAENIRVLGSASQNVDKFAQRVATAQAELANPTATAQEFKTTMEAFYASTTDASNSWEQFKKTIGQGLAPAATVVLKAFADGLSNVSVALTKMPPLVQQTVTWIAVLTTVAVPAGLALRALATTFAIFGGSALVTAIGGVAAAFGAIPIAIAAITVALAAVTYYIYTEWDAVKKYLSEPIDMGSVWTNLKNDWAVFFSWFKSENAKVSEDTKKLMDTGGAGKAAIVPRAPVNVGANSTVSDEAKALVERLDNQTKLLSRIREEEFALQNLMDAGSKDTWRQQRGIDDEAISRFRGLIALEKIRADAVKDRIKSLGEETTTAAAFTALQKNIVDMESQIRAVREKKGALNAAEEASLRTQIGLLQQSKIDVAFKSASYDLAKTLETSRALTQEQKNQVEIAQKLRDYTKENAEVDKGRLAAIAAQTAMIQQQNQFNAARDSIDTVGAANRAYQDTLLTINKALKEGVISATEYGKALAQLNRMTLDARDPWGAQTKSMNDNIQLMRLMGDYSEADRQTQQTLNQMRDRGVQITGEHVRAVEDYNRAMQDAAKSQSSGLEGWAKSIGSVRDQILDMQKSLAGAISQGWADFFNTGETNLRKFAINALSSITKMFTDMALKDVAKALGNNLGGIFSGMDSKSALDKAGSAAGALGGLPKSTAMMEVSAGTVNVNGALTSGANAIAGVSGGTAGGAGLGSAPQPVYMTDQGGIPLPTSSLTSGPFVANSPTDPNYSANFGGVITGSTATGTGDGTVDTSGIDAAKASIDSLNASATDAASATDRVNQGFSSLRSSGADAGANLDSASYAMQNVGVNATVAAPSVDMMGNSTGMTGNAASNAAPQIEAAGNALEMAGQKAGAASAASGFGPLGSIFTSLATSVGTSFVRQKASQMHSGGLVGRDGTAISVPAHLFDHAPRFHSGLKSDELAAVLQRGESVLTARDTKRAVAAGSAGGGINNAINFQPVMTFEMGKGGAQANAPSEEMADRFSSLMENAMRKTVMEVIISESRPGGTLARVA